VISQKQWVMIKVVQKYLMYYAVLDFSLQIISQLPIIPEQERFRDFGFRKIWSQDSSNPMRYE